MSNFDNNKKENNFQSSTLLIKDFGGINALMSALKTDRETGIDPSTIKERVEVFGSNYFAPPKIKGALEIFLDNFKDPINVILCVAAVVNMCIGTL